jgi:hypothetical protein
MSRTWLHHLAANPIGIFTGTFFLHVDGTGMAAPPGLFTSAYAASKFRQFMAESQIRRVNTIYGDGAFVCRL